jgi:transposase-like protein
VNGTGEVRQMRIYPVEEMRRIGADGRAWSAAARVVQAKGVKPNVLLVWRRQHRKVRLTVGDANPVQLRYRPRWWPPTTNWRFPANSNAVWTRLLFLTRCQLITVQH